MKKLILCIWVLRNSKSGLAMTNYKKVLRAITTKTSHLDQN